MNSLRLLSRLLAVVNGAAVLLVVPALAGPAPAGAAVQPCTVTYAGPERTILPDTPDQPGDSSGKHALTGSDIKIADTRFVTDIDVSWDINHADATQVSLHVIGPKTQPNLAPSIQTYNTGMATGPLNGRYSFDDEAGTTKLVGPSPASNTYLPATPATGLEQYPANGGWSLWVLNQAPYAATLRSWSLTLTYATCDTDGDGVEDKADNCPTAANADQANRDTDGLGDACDLDIDGDSLANTGDGCPTASSSNATGCPSASRKASLRWVKAKKRLEASITSPVAACSARARIVLWRVRPNRDFKLVGVTATSRGRYLFKVPRGSRYYVTVSPSYASGQAECAKATSRKVRAPRA